MSQNANEEVLLSDLCAICHTNPLKYTCPRCGIHTCSLPCVKRHKLWAQCSGVRDPAAFRKRNELATPSSIDQDFNFITKLERSIQRADDEAIDRGIDLMPAGVLRQYPSSKSKFDQEAESRGMVIVKAPRGLSRNKQNKSHWDFRHKCMMWTIEWILPDDRKVVANAQDSKSVIDAYRTTVGRKGFPRKRPRDEAEQAVGKEGEQKETPGDVGDDVKIGDKPAATSALVSNLYFYLHRPNTSSKLKCLVPVSQLDTLAEVLREKTVLEFPTIYVRTEGPDGLQDPYILETMYLERQGVDLPINLPVYIRNDEEHEEIKDLPEQIDDKKILEVLKKDLAA